MNRSPAPGDVIKLPKSRSEWVVVRSRREESEDRLRGDMYIADVFDVINYVDLGKTNPKVRTYSIKENSDMRIGTVVSIKDVDFIEKVSVVKEVVTTYKVKK